ncbi:MAG: hypothetical protein HY097_00890, partial [Nitrospinae bacterium]|nr:hypothetical protein [Nitrospinota bacterium]
MPHCTLKERNVKDTKDSAETLSFKTRLKRAGFRLKMIKDRTIKFLRCLFNTPSQIPVEAQIEITNKCNFTCLMCPRDIMDVPSINMDFGLFKEVVRKLSTP